VVVLALIMWLEGREGRHLGQRAGFEGVYKRTPILHVSVAPLVP
jgi:hypothetical protein